MASPRALAVRMSQPRWCAVAYCSWPSPARWKPARLIIVALVGGSCGITRTIAANREGADRVTRLAEHGLLACKLLKHLRGLYGSVGVSLDTLSEARTTRGARGWGSFSRGFRTFVRRSPLSPTLMFSTSFATRTLVCAVCAGAGGVRSCASHCAGDHPKGEGDDSLSHRVLLRHRC